MVEYFHKLLPWARLQELEKRNAELQSELTESLARETKQVAENKELLKENARLKSENEVHEEREKAFGFLVPVDLGDPAPTDGPKYKSYVAAIAGLHKEILRPKFEQMISVAHNLLEKQGAGETDNMLRGTIYCLRELIVWGESMVNKQIANQNEQNDH